MVLQVKVQQISDDDQESTMMLIQKHSDTVVMKADMTSSFPEAY